MCFRTASAKIIMNNRLLKYGTTAIVVAAAIVLWRTFTASALLYDTKGALLEDMTATSTRNVVASSTVPARLSIPALDINAPIQKVGLNANGAMSAPTKYSEVAWYMNGTIPGNKGSAVLAGHLDNGLGLAGVFKNLTKIKVGDEIYVKDSNGPLMKFSVNDIRTIDYNDIDGNLIFAPEDDKSLIRLITCGGKWMPERKTYDKRVVITAELAK